MARTFESTRDVIIQVASLAEAKRFYEQVLGFTSTPHGDRLVAFETGSFTLYVEEGASPGPVFDYLVEDPAAAKQQLVAAGCTVVEEDPSVPRIYVRDPFGVTFNVGKR
jgi:catechol 2,3-dioxygenase-like lactoylglutathione lyase family enzyme